MVLETREQREARAKQEKRETAQLLRGLLERTRQNVNLLKIWYVSADTVHTVALMLEEYGYLHTARDAIYYFEKPYKYETDMRELAKMLEDEVNS